MKQRMLLPHDRIEMQNDAIKDAYLNLDEEEKAVIDRIAKNLIARFGRQGFGVISAIELIGKVGIWMSENDYKGSDDA